MIPVAKPSITRLEKRYVKEALESGFISHGPFVTQFEERWAAYNGYKYGVACNSGTTAMFLALKALGVGNGEEVVVPEFTMAATAWAVSYTGANPVFVDCADDLNMDINKIREVLKPKTSVIMPVHIYGRKCHMDMIRVAIRQRRIKIVEDMAEAHGIKPSGDIACYSFQGNKIITTGEGGMCLTNDIGLAEEMRKLSTLYFDFNRTLLHNKIGYNFKMTNLQAAIGCAQLDRIDEILNKRKRIEKLYNKLLPDYMHMPPRQVLWMYDVIVGKKQEEVKKRLLKKGVDSRYFFKPMSRQSMYNRHWQNLNASKWSEVGLYLPTYTDMTKEEVKYVADSLIEVQRELDFGTL